MPVVHVEWLAGRDAAMKAALAQRIRHAMQDLDGTDPAHVWVVFRDVSAEDWPA